MLASIVLPAGTDKILFKDMPNLFALARWPELPHDEQSNLITTLKKKSVRDKTNHERPLSANDLAELSRGCWKQLPSLKLPIEVEKFQPYLAAFESQTKRDWELSGDTDYPALGQVIRRTATATQWKEIIAQAVTNEQLTPRCPNTFIPMPDVTGDSLLKCFVTVADFQTFAASLEFDVRIAEATGPAPAESKSPSDADLLTPNESSSGAKPGLIRADILAVNWPLTGNFTNDSFNAALSDVPDWLRTARMTPGRPGRNGSATWNPALIAVALIGENYARENSFDTFFAAHFPTWVYEWNECKDSL